MSFSYVSHLCDKATALVKAGRPIDLVLFAKLMENGIDVEELERSARHDGTRSHTAEPLSPARA